MTWLSLISNLVKLVGLLAGWARDQGLISQGETIILADALEAQANDVDKGRAARAAQRLRDVGGVSDAPDQFRRD